uniref:Uncharacterized protein n=1 Tax=Avena sativa TaxID=4498 RepID=A0ACD6AF33_AVESA
MLDDNGKLHRVAVDAVGPRPTGVAVGGVDAHPRDAVALEPSAEGDHPHPVTLLHTALGLRVRQLVQHGAAGRIAQPVQRHPRRLHVLVGEPEPGLRLVDHAAPSRVDAEVLERRPEVRPVELLLHPGAAAGQEYHLVLEEGQHHAEFLGDRQDERGEGGDVFLQRAAGSGRKIPGEADRRVAPVVLVHVHAPVVLVPRGGDGAHHVAEPEPRAPPLRGVGQDHGGGAHAEEAVGEKHRAVRSHVIRRRQDLCGNDQRARAGRRLPEDVPDEADRHECGAAPHPGQVHAPHVGAELVPVDDHVGERGDRCQDAAVQDEHVHVRGRQEAPGLGERLVDGGEEDQLGLLARRLQAPVRGHAVVRRRHAGLLAEPRPLDQPHHEVHALLVVQVRHEVRVLAASR